MSELSLPHWDLSDLYHAFNCDELIQDKANVLKEAIDFNHRYTGKISSLSAETFLQALKDYEQLQDLIGKIGSYSYLLYSTQTLNKEISAFFQDTSEHINRCETHLVFFVLEINKLSDDDFSQLLAYEPLAFYMPWLRDCRIYAPYQLDQPLEQLFIEKQASACAPWMRLYEDICNRMDVIIDGEPVSLTTALDYLSDIDENKRKNAATALSQSFASHVDDIALIYNTLIKDKAIEDKWRNFSSPQASRNLANLIEDDVVDTLINSVSKRYSDLSERYYHYKAKKMGKDTLHYWDRNAPYLVESEEYIPWAECKEIVLNAYQAFSPEMSDIATMFFDKNWIDVPVLHGKTSGAYSHPTVASSHPYILLNYQGKHRDILTLAHELGHGIHQVLAAKQGTLIADTPLTLAETASVFGEQLVFDYLIQHETSNIKKQNLVAAKIEDMLNTVVRQVAFYKFEHAVHTARIDGELTVDMIGDLWMSTQQDSFGSAVSLDCSYRNYWVYISHFFHTPFYVYAYAFGDCLVNSLYGVYEQAKKNNKSDEFVSKYILMLTAGGRYRHKELLQPFSLDISESSFWDVGLDRISTLINALEEYDSVG